MVAIIEIVIPFLLRLANNCKAKLFLKDWGFCLGNNLNRIADRDLKMKPFCQHTLLLQMMTTQPLCAVDAGCPEFLLFSWWTIVTCQFWLPGEVVKPCIESVELLQEHHTVTYSMCMFYSVNSVFYNY